MVDSSTRIASSARRAGSPQPRATPWVLCIILTLLSAGSARAGLHYSGERVAELPSRWSGFLVDQRSLRMAGIEQPKNAAPSPLRETYLAAAAKLEQGAKSRQLTADELADLGALYVRLGKPDKA